MKTVFRVEVFVGPKGSSRGGWHDALTKEIDLPFLLATGMEIADDAMSPNRTFTVQHITLRTEGATPAEVGAYLGEIEVKDEDAGGKLISFWKSSGWKPVSETCRGAIGGE